MLKTIINISAAEREFLRSVLIVMSAEVVISLVSLFSIFPDLLVFIVLILILSFVILNIACCVVPGALTEEGQKSTTLGFYVPIALIFVVHVSVILSMFAGRYAVSGIIYTETSTHIISHDYFDGLYFSITTWTTLGLGDFLPANRACRFWVATECITGYLIMSLLIVAVIGFINDINNNSKQEYNT